MVSLICLSAIIVNCIQVCLVFWFQFVDEKSFQCPLFTLCILPIMGLYWWIQHFYRLTADFRGK